MKRGRMGTTGGISHSYNALPELSNKGGQAAIAADQEQAAADLAHQASRQQTFDEAKRLSDKSILKSAEFYSDNMRNTGGPKGKLTSPQPGIARATLLTNPLGVLGTVPGAEKTLLGT